VSAAAAAVPATAVATTLAGELHAGRMCSGVFLVEDIKGRQADVENFFLAESDYVTRYILLGYILGRTNNCRGCAARHG
jgi:5-carboxymethyl-2-hydroxymuconate isomerase